MGTKIFLSYVYEDIAHVLQLRDWATKGLLGQVTLVNESEDVRQKGDSAVYAHLRSVMRGADAILVLVGQDTHNREWVDKEIRYFIGAGKPILATRLPNTTGGTPPGLKGSLLAQFTPSSIKAAIDAAFPPKPALF
jgi:hypothetical protein